MPDVKQTPLWVRLVLRIGDFVIRRFFPYAVSGHQRYSARPATLVVSNHRRDLDGPLLSSVLLRRKGWRLQAPLPHFVAREDLFDAGFLAHYMRRPPRVLTPLLTRLNLQRFLTRCGAYPLQRTHERSVAAVLREIIVQAGDLPVTDVFRNERLQSLAGTYSPVLADTTRISALLHGDTRRLERLRYGYRHIQPRLFRRIKAQIEQVIEAQLTFFTGLLERGYMLILEPEGRLSLDGHIHRPRGALYQLINRPQRSVCVLPVAITYDALTTGKTRIFVDIQPEISDLRGLPRQQLDTRVMSAIRAGCRVTAAQLAVAFWRSRGNGTWTENELASRLYDAAQACAAAGLTLDPCLQQHSSCKARTHDLLKWSVRVGWLRHDLSGTFYLSNTDMPPPWLPDGPVPLLDYLHAELMATVGDARVDIAALMS